MITFRIKYGMIQATPTTRPPTTCFATAGSSKTLIGAASAAKAVDVHKKKVASSDGKDSITLAGIEGLLITSAFSSNKHICVGTLWAKLADFKILEDVKPFTRDSNDRAAPNTRVFGMAVLELCNEIWILPLKRHPRCAINQSNQVSETDSDRLLKDPQPVCNASLTGEDKLLSSEGKVSRRSQMLDVLDDIKCRKSNIARHEKAVVALSYSFDGTLLATASADSTAQILEPKTGLKKTTLEGEHNLGLNDCCWVDERLLVTASDDNSLVLWDIEMGKAVTVMHGHTSYAYCVTANPMNRTVLSGGYDGNVMIFDVTSGACIAGYNAHTEAITSIEYSAYGSYFITGSEDGFARIWDSATNAGCLHTIYTESRSPISSVTFAPNGQHLVVSSLDSIHRLFCYKISSAYSSNSAGPKYLKSFKLHYNKRFSIITAVTSFRNKNVSGSYLVSGSEDNQVYIWDMNNDENKPTILEGHTDIVLAVACHPDPHACQIVSASKDCTVKLWEPADRTVSEVNS